MGTDSDLQQVVNSLKAQGYNDIVFFQPALNIGGGPLVEANLAKCLARETDLHIYFCDYPNGWGAFNCADEPSVTILTYKETDINFPLQKKCVVFTNSTRVILLKNMHPESKVLFWHYETIKCAWDIVLIDGETKKYLQLAKKNNSMCYHDWSARNSLNLYCGTGFCNDDFIFIPLEEKSMVCKTDHVKNDSVNVGFLSRLATDKVCSLYQLVQNFAEYKTEKKKFLHIIGDGNKFSEAKKFCAKYEDKIQFVFTGSIARENLDSYLVDNIDILFGVGTSVLEGASLHIPSAAMLMDTKRFEDRDAWWIFDTKNYCVGILREQKEDFEKTGAKYTPINDMIEAVCSDGGKKKYGDMCYDYYLKNHSSYYDCMLNFLRLAEKSTLIFSKIRSCIKFIPYNLIKITRFKVLGIPFKKIEWNGGMKVVFAKNRYLQLFKKIQEKSCEKYYIMRIKVLTVQKRKIPYNFPSALFDDRGKFMKQEITVTSPNTEKKGGSI